MTMKFAVCAVLATCLAFQASASLLDDQETSLCLARLDILSKLPTNLPSISGYSGSFMKQKIRKSCSTVSVEMTI